ncbi:RNA polymerase sigma-70 factor, ECF subfamily [Mucilaginibacter pineti]|uniref:RNA polymerase sigma-70 factor, ECF subfamily n=1 Tax=Mucilaginibacter pineti TaxID=1391627 RepID=A0A1G7FXE0_9SPHI|nr:sigma-70 family RNA polymerase sigma factor [Mucilaginibacter pineti]SDE80549.1 RNA polymerase sigma-70 factor, ECF subfamily [Mucilaginibacter pineti]
MQSDCNEKELLGNLKQGCSVAFNAIYQLYSKPIYIYLLHKLKDPDMCSDVLQDIFVALWEKREATIIDTSLKGYLFQSARFKIVDIYRKDKKFQSYLAGLGSYMDADYSMLGDVLDHRKQLADTMDEINKMPLRMKEIFIASRIEQENIQHIANRLSISKQTVKNQLGKAMRILRMNYSGVEMIIMFIGLLLIKK